MPRTSKTKPTAGHQSFIVEAEKRLQDPLLQKPVAFDIADGSYGQSIYSHFQQTSRRNPEQLQSCLKIVGDHCYIYGSVARESKKKGSNQKFYEVQWEHDYLGTTTIEYQVVITANELYSRLTPIANTSNQSTAFLAKTIRRTLCAVDDLNYGFDPYDSDAFPHSETEFIDNSDCESISHDRIPIYRQPPITGEAAQEGYCWSSAGRLDPPPFLSTHRRTHVKAECRGSFKTPSTSLLAFIPLKMFKAFAVYSNKYANKILLTKSKICGSKWRDIDLQEMMTFFGILIKMVLRPTPGRNYTFCWEDPNWHPYTKHMSLGRFKQIRSVIHFNDNSKIKTSQDAVFKVRELMKTNLLYMYLLSIITNLFSGPSITKHS